MSASSRWNTLSRDDHSRTMVDYSRTPRAAAWWVGLGAILGLVTIILSAASLVSATQAIALALPATIITIGGLIRSVFPDYYTAWRRGFRQGCEVAMTCQRELPYPGGQPGLPPAAL
jgi:hypothetical protein